MAKNIPALTGLRFFAAMTIVLWHSQGDYFFPANAFAPLFLAGAVPLFFVLSGFVLTINAGKYAAWSDFLVARIARIWPAHLATLALFVAISPHGAGNLWRLMTNAMLLQAWVPDAATYWSYNAPSWSLSCELFFYAAFPLAFTLMSRAPLMGAALIATGTLAAVAAIAAALPSLDAGWLAGINPLSCFPAFTIGIAAGLRFEGRTRDGRAVIQVGALMLAVVANAAFYWFGSLLTPVAGTFLTLFGAAPFYAVLILSLARYRGPVSQVLSHPACVYGGEISYSIYLTHQLVLRWHAHIGGWPSLPAWSQYAVVLAIIGAASMLLHALIERPGRRILVHAWTRCRRMSPNSLSRRS